MEHIFLSVVTDNREYGRALSLAMLSVCRNFIIRIFGTEEFLTEEFFSKTGEPDLILWDGAEAKDTCGGKLVYLAERPSDAVKNPVRKRYCIYKYSTAEHMVAAIFEIYEAITGRCAVNLKRQNVHLFGFTSCTGGAGCSAIARAVGQELCRFRSKRVLYLSFEEIESTGCLMSCGEERKGAGVYLYHLFKHTGKGRLLAKGQMLDSAPFLDSYLVRDDFGMEAFSPVQGRNPLRELNPEEVCKCISALIDSGRFDVILMDLGAWLSRTGIACLEMAEKLCLVTAAEESCVREEQYISHLVCSCGEDILKKVIRVQNMAGAGKGGLCEEAQESSVIEKHMDISRCRTVIKEGKRKKLLLEGAFGSDVAALTEQMTEPM